MCTRWIKNIIFTVSLASFISIPTVAYAKRIVKGMITDKNGNPAANVRVKVMDSDWPDPDQEMCRDMTDTNGRYECQYEGKPGGEWWDWSPSKGWTIWRPDIYIKISTPVNGWCEGGTWNEDRNWKYLSQSGVTSNHRMSDDLTKNLQLNNYPLSEVKVQNFTRGVNMYCKVEFFLTGYCFGCSDEGDKVQWRDWGFGGPTQTAERCWFPPNPQCTDEDYGKIQGGGVTRPIDPERH